MPIMRKLPVTNFGHIVNRSFLHCGFFLVNNSMENTTQQITAEITVQDLRGLKTCLEIAVQRGAYKADEMTAIGHVYDRLAKFIATVDANQAQNESQPQSQPTESNN